MRRSYEIDRGENALFAGEYPGDRKDECAENKIKHMIHFGIRHFIDLTEEGELRYYSRFLPEDVTYWRFPIEKDSVPDSLESMHGLLNRINELKHQGGFIYLHCRDGVTRTGVVAACYLAKKQNKRRLFDVLNTLSFMSPRMFVSPRHDVSLSQEQLDFIEQFISYVHSEKEIHLDRVSDYIRGSLMGGAAGDALGYPVEFMTRQGILSKYGLSGIKTFELNRSGKALVSDDTQMTLFTANGLLVGLTRGYMGGIDGRPENYVDKAYIDWYYTQTGEKNGGDSKDFHYTWLRDLPELAHRRAPGNTCLTACFNLLHWRKVDNNSKGCGGIMRVAPLALLLAGTMARCGKSPYSIPEMFEASAHIARVTHLHPLGFLPAGMLTELLFKLVPLSPEEAKERIVGIAEDIIKTLDKVFVGQYEEEKRYLAELTRKAIRLAHSSTPDYRAIEELGEGWTGEETWAISLFCVIRHIDNIHDAIVASVNHNGDSDSTGSITGNIMGVIYGYEEIKRLNLFCPDDTEFEDTIELANIILAIADDLATGCIISEYSPRDTPAKKLWFERYCEMKPSGLK